MATIIKHQQGSPEWHAHRAKHYNASEAAAMLGIDPKCKRSELIRMKALGTDKEFSDWVQTNILDKGHEYEAMARGMAEEMIGDSLFPVVMRDDIDGLPLSASCDGLTMDGTIGWEHKRLNKMLAASLDLGIIPDQYHPQLEQQLLITAAEKIMFMVSDGDPETGRYAWYESNPELRARIIAGWKQFAEDVANYEHEPEVVKPVGRAPETLPSLYVEVSGMVTNSNLPEFKQTALAVIGSINTTLATDEDFADAEKTVKWCGEVENRLKQTKLQAQGQMASIDELFRAIDDIHAAVREKRLMLDKLVAAEKDNRKAEIINAARNELAQHVEKLNLRIGGKYMPMIDGKFAECAKGLKTLSSMKDKVSTGLSMSKMEANEIADRIELNLKHMEQHAEHKALFADISAICNKDTDDFKAIVYARITDFKQREEKRLEEERAKIRAEEEARAAAKAAAEQPKPMEQNTPPSGQAGMPAGARPESAAPVASIPRKTPEDAVIDSEPTIRAFIASREWKKGEDTRVRAILVEYEKFRATSGLKAA